MCAYGMAYCFDTDVFVGHGRAYSICIISFNYVKEGGGYGRPVLTVSHSVFTFDWGLHL